MSIGFNSMDFVPRSASKAALFEAFAHKLSSEQCQVDIVQHAEGEVKTLSDGTKYKITHRGWVKMKVDK
jgi:hypothetical protein